MPQYIATINSILNVHVELQMSKRISRTLETTKFKGVPIVSVSAKPGGQEVCIIIMTI